MPPNLDVYVISKRRDQETVDRFVAAWVDRERSEDRGDEELMLVPLGATCPSDDTDGWEWEPALTLTKIMRFGLSKPPRAFAVYLEPRDPSLAGVCLAFTTDDHVVFGVSIDDEGAKDINLGRAKHLMGELVHEFGGYAGCIGVEEPPPLSATAFPQTNSRSIIYGWPL